MIEVKLTPHEVWVGALIGVERRIQSLSQNIKGKHGISSENVWQIDIEGACGEIVVAKTIGIYWQPTVGTFKSKPDIGPYFEVRTTSQEHHKLIVREEDDNSAIYVLVIGQAPTYHVAGWIIGSQAKKPEYIQSPNNRPPAYFVPQDKLYPIETLIGAKQPKQLNIES